MSLEEKDEKTGEVPVDGKRRFAELQKLETIYLAAAHQYELQKLVGKSVALAVTEIEKGRSESDGSIEVIEIGIGKGFTTDEILKANQKVKISGVDNDGGMVRQAKDNLSEYMKAGRFEIEEADALEFLKKFRDNSVPIIASGFTLHNFQKDYRRAVLEEIRRVLSPDGIFINADKIMPDDSKELKREMRQQIARFEDIPDEAVRKQWIKHYEEDMHPDVIMIEGEHRRELEKIGFRDISITNRMHLEVLVVAEK